MSLPLSPEAFRDVAARYASGVVVVTTQADGFDHAMTATSFTTVSLEPMQALVCVEKQTRFHDALLDTPDGGVGAGWAVSILPAEAVSVASWFATKGRPLHGQFARIPHTRGPATGSVILTEAIASLELRTVATVSAGDHTVVLGDVCSLSEAADPDARSANPLLYWARRYRNLSD